jgi:hypothetical protein
MKNFSLLILMGIFSSIFMQCESSNWQSEDSHRWKEVSPKGANTGLVPLYSDQTRVDFQNFVSKKNIVHNRHLLNGAGVTTGDVDGDGLIDIYFCRTEGSNVLYRNLGGWKFEDITDKAGVACKDQFSTGTVLSDIDGDNDLDLLVTALGGPNAVFLNDGSGQFHEVTKEAGLMGNSGATTMALADVDGDGDLDIYMANDKKRSVRDIYPLSERVFEKTTRRTEDGWEVLPEFQEHYTLNLQGNRLERFEYAEPDYFFLNNGSGHFDREELNGGRFLDADGKPIKENYTDWGLTVRFQDFDNDGDPDIYVCNDFESPDRIWSNDGDGQFSPMPALAIRNTSASSMGIDFTDVNRDGAVDFFVVEMLSRDHKRRKTQMGPMSATPISVGEIDNRPQYMRNTLFLNRGDNTYAEIAQYGGVQASEWSWSPLFLDVDLDGYEDILVVTGHYYDAMDADVQSDLKTMNYSRYSQLQSEVFAYNRLATRDFIFKNRGDLTFEEVGKSWGFSSEDISHGMALADLDNDGDLDVVINRLESEAGIYRNESSAPRIAVRLRGDSPNTQGIGAKVKLLGGPVDQMKEIISGGSYLSGSDPLVSFAAWDEKREFILEVTWRSGDVSRIEGVKGNRLYEVYESSSTPASPPIIVDKSPMYEDVSHLINHRHHEEPYNDFARQSLLPARLSQLGPGVAWGDVDSDGDDDLVLPSGRGGRLSLFINTGGTFREIEGSVTGHDQTGVVIYPSSSGPEILVGHSNFESTVEETSFIQGYRVEDGNLIKTRRISTNLSSVGALCMADVDGDEDLDLFAGGRTVPGRYPEPASSMLFINDGSNFVPDSKNSAHLEEIGLITGALFSDIDSDNDPDLILAMEWGPVTILENDGGSFSDATASYGLSDYVGWWNGVATGDFNEDGRLDIVATNWGMNTKYHISEDHPLELYYADFDRNGTLDIVEGHWDEGMDAMVPERGLSCLSRGIPYIKSRKETYADFGESDLYGILGHRLTEADKIEATVLGHSIFLKTDEGFQRIELHSEAQFSPAFGAVVADMDGDGHEDIFLSQNFFAYQIETSRSDAGRGLWLRGDGTGVLVPVPGQESGIEVYGEQRGAAAADFDGDGRVDLVVSQNGAPTKMYRNILAKPGLRLENLVTVGAKVRVMYEDGTAGPIREIQIGSSYWSQNGASTLGSRKKIKTVVIKWPDGNKSQLSVNDGESVVIVRRN